MMSVVAQSSQFKWWKRHKSFIPPWVHWLIGVSFYTRHIIVWDHHNARDAMMWVASSQCRTTDFVSIIHAFHVVLVLWSVKGDDSKRKNKLSIIQNKYVSKQDTIHVFSGSKMCFVIYMESVHDFSVIISNGITFWFCSFVKAQTI